MHPLFTRFSGLIVVAFIGCGEEMPEVLTRPDASMDRDVSVPDTEAPDAGLVDTSVFSAPRCAPEIDFVELPLPRAAESGAVFAQRDGVIYAQGTPQGVYAWTWAEREVKTIAVGRLMAASDGMILYDSRRGVVLLGRAETHRLGGQSFGFPRRLSTLGQPYGAEFLQSDFVAWPSESAFRLKINIFDYEDEHRETGLVDVGPAVSANHVAWLETSTTSKNDWRWAVENPLTRQQFETRIAKHTTDEIAIKVTENAAYVFQPRGGDTVLHAWLFADGLEPVVVPTDLRGQCRFLAGVLPVLYCDSYPGSLYLLTPTRVTIVRTGGGSIRGASQSIGRVLFVEIDGAESGQETGQVVVVNLSSGERLELTDTFSFRRGGQPRTSFVGDVAVWSIDNSPVWGAAQLCP